MNMLGTISNLFEENEIRSIWDKEKGDYYYSVVDVIEVLTDLEDPVVYWHKLKKTLLKEGYKPSCQEIIQIEFKHVNGKKYLIDMFNVKGLYRIIQSINYPKADKYKNWMASIGSERIDEIFDPEIAVNRAINYYKKCGYDDGWISSKLNIFLNSIL